ncbi:MAG: DUF1564 family protein [Leptospira sp.]|nr:DUF1564 family protein [Leptospira sp.]
MHRVVKPKWEARILVKESRRTSSTLNIPERFVPFLLLKRDQFSGLHNYLHFLLNKFRYLNFSGSLPRADKAKTDFQDSGQGIVPFSFRPDNFDWLELKLIAQTHNKSATKFFIILMILDMHNFDQAAGEGVPAHDLSNPLTFWHSLHPITGIYQKQSSYGGS